MSEVKPLTDEEVVTEVANSEAILGSDISSSQVRIACAGFLRWAATLKAERAKSAALEAELERERMRMCACGVVAMANTPETAARAREMHADYRSASCEDVAAAVDREMAARARIARLEEALRLCVLKRRGDDPSFPKGMRDNNAPSEDRIEHSARADVTARAVLAEGEPRKESAP